MMHAVRVREDPHSPAQPVALTFTRDTNVTETRENMRCRNAIHASSFESLLPAPYKFIPQDKPKLSTKCRWADKPLCL